MKNTINNITFCQLLQQFNLHTYQVSTIDNGINIMTRSHKRLITSKKKRLFVSYLVMKALKVKLRKEKEKTTFFS